MGGNVVVPIIVVLTGAAALATVALPGAGAMYEAAGFCEDGQARDRASTFAADQLAAE